MPFNIRKMLIFLVRLSWSEQNRVLNYNNSSINFSEVQDLLEGKEYDFCVHEVELGDKSFQFLC